MRLDEEVGYARTEDWQVVSLPAFGGVRAVILLPYGDLARFGTDPVTPGGPASSTP